MLLLDFCLPCSYTRFVREADEVHYGGAFTLGMRGARRTDGSHYEREFSVSSEEANTHEEGQNSTEEAESSEETEASGQQSGGGSGHHARSTEETPDVTLDVPKLGLDEAHLKVDNLRARISLQSELADMVKINVGVDAFLETVELDLKGLEAEALLKANLENVREILVRTLESLDNNPDLVDSLAQMADNSGKGLEGDRLDQEEAAREPEEESAEEIEATDAARSKAEDLNVDLSQVEGTGSGGRIIARDVQQAANKE